jgi:hypothetical protein
MAMAASPAPISFAAAGSMINFPILAGGWIDWFKERFTDDPSERFTNDPSDQCSK